MYDSKTQFPARRGSVLQPSPLFAPPLWFSPKLGRAFLRGAIPDSRDRFMKRRNTVTAWLLLLPLLAGLIVFWVAPGAILVWRSFFTGAGSSRFVGISNYGRVLGSRAFRMAAGNTALFLAVSVPLLLAVGFVFAQAINRRLSGSRLFQSVLLSPLVLPAAGIVTLVQIFFSDSGLLNALLARLGQPAAYWLDSGAAFWIVVFVFVWKNMGYTTILLMVGLNGIPKELFQIADLDGATARQKLWHVTLPLMIPTLFFTSLLSVINSFKIYREVLLLGGEHPAPDIYFLQHYIANNFSQMDYASVAVATVLFVLAVSVFLAAFYRLQQKLEV